MSETRQAACGFVPSRKGPHFFPRSKETAMREILAAVPLKTVLLLTLSNIFMTTAWYGHLKFTKSWLPVVILASWLIALPEYCFQVPANRLGQTEYGLSA